MDKIADAWPFEDCDRGDPLIAHRIAVSSSHPRWCYLVSFDRESPDRPTDAETTMLVSFLDEYKAHWYNPSYLAKLASKPLDVDGGANGVTFHKYGTDDWGYRRRSWEYGPLFVPQHPRVRDWDREEGRKVPGPFDLARLMDYVHTIGDDKPMPRWTEWKAAHPDVFPVKVG